MRITTALMTRNLLARLEQSTERLARLQEQIASGLRVIRPSDDPPAARRAAALKSGLSEIGQFLKNCDEARSLLSMTDDALAQITNLVQQARTSALTGATDTASQASRQSLAAVIDQTMQSLVTAANAERAGRYLFAGFKTTAAPFALNAGGSPPVSYSGDSGVSLFQIGRSSNVEVNLAGDQVFNINGQASPDLPDLFSTLDGLKQALLAGDTDAIQTSITEIDDHLSRLLTLRAEVGARVQGLDLAQDRLTSTQLYFQDLVSQAEDADLAKAVVELQAQQNIYQATAAAAALLSQPGLLQYLG
jgi:flagellar hook-associated protein 3 FlgL